jgi:hypothetical protein
MMPTLRNQRQELFAQALAQGKTADAAYLAAGYKPNRGNASTLKAKQSIRNRVAEIQQGFDRHFIVTKQYIIDRLIENARKSLGHLPVKIGAVGAEVEQLVYEPAPANAALRLAGLELGMFKEKAEVRHVTSFDHLSDEQLVRLIMDEANALLIGARAQADTVDVVPNDDGTD